MNRRFAIAALLSAPALALADPASVAPPAGAPMLLELQADGVQIYACAIKDGVSAWDFKAPEANLFDASGRQVGTHSAGPSWTLDDGSSVVGSVAAKADAPVAGAVPWLLLTVKSRSGAGRLTPVETIRRAETKGGAAPRAGCDAGHVGEQARMRYSATYQFYGAAR
jgi:hypothetical protein